MNLKSTYNKIAEDWFKDHFGDSWWQEGTDAFLSLLPNDSSVLDIGCGPGLKSQYIQKKGFKATGIDFSENMIEIARREAPSINFEVVDVYEIDKYKKSFDGILMQAVLLHIPRDKVMDVLIKVKERLNPGGLFYVASKAARGNNPVEEIKKENDYGYEYERFFSFFTMNELEEYFKKLDMKVVLKMSTMSGKTEWLQIVGRRK